MRLNKAIKPDPIFTHEGARAKRINPEQELRRSVMSCMLWENGFYESGETIADRIVALIPKVKPDTVAEIAIQARKNMKLRHVPLLIVATMAKLTPEYRKLVPIVMAGVIQRADELTEFMAIYWKNGKSPKFAHCVRRGLANVFPTFNEYELAKYNRDGAVKLKDVLFMCHAKPIFENQPDVWKRLIDGKLVTPDTWEVALSSSTDKKQTWTRLLKEQKLGALALIRNLRNMMEAKVEVQLIRDSLNVANIERVLPYRFIAAAKHAPRLEPELETMMLLALKKSERLSGETIILVDVSGSMDHQISSKSELTRLDAACGLAILAREISNARIVTFSNDTIEVRARRGFALRDAIITSQQHSGTYLGKAVTAVSKHEHDRLIVITDEQSADRVPDPVAKNAYMINVASNKNGIGYGKWTHIDGWSEAVLDFINECESTNLQ